jgi:hypothetical protein
MVVPATVIFCRCWYGGCWVLSLSFMCFFSEGFLHLLLCRFCLFGVLVDGGCCDGWGRGVEFVRRWVSTWYGPQPAG